MYHIFHDIDIKASREDIYSMLISPDKLNIWWTVKSEGQAEVNGEYRFYFSEEYDWKAKVLEMSHGETLTYQMIKADSDWKDTLLSFEIIEKDREHHILRFEHRQWRQVNDHFRRSNYCWALYLNDLKKYVEQNVISASDC